MTAAVTAFVDDSVAAIRNSATGTLSDVVVIDHNRIVLGRVRGSDLEAAPGTDLIGEIMRLGPTTIRPDELVSEVTDQMVKKGVGLLLVTRPTGELVGAFVPSQEDRDG